jgi:4'-phosphopantetheinyl transferase
VLQATPAEAAAAERLADVLDAKEQKRAAGFVRPADRVLYLVAHVGLRLALGAYLGRAPGAVELRQAACPLCGGPHGRPEVVGEPGLHFSLSHAGAVVLCAVAAAPVGVDVESAAHIKAASELLTALHPGERDAVLRLPQDRQPEGILHCWVRKEAYLKGLGTGLGIDPATVEVGLGPVHGDAAARPVNGWSLASVAVPEGYAAALALRQPAEPAVRVGPLLLAETER